MLERLNQAVTVHPRACGEHGKRLDPKKLCPGSSPRLRGTPMRTPSAKLVSRFIPAPAGNTVIGCACAG